MTDTRARTTLVVAIDGPSGAGKSTVARTVARRLGLRYLDTGAMYRAVTHQALAAGAELTDAAAVQQVWEAMDLFVDTDPGHPAIRVDGADVGAAIRSAEVTAAVSAASAHPDLRRAVVERQRAEIGAGGIVVEGRDIGTVVVPDAAVKIFLTASGEERARRRTRQLGTDDVAALAAAQARRDTLDSTRAASPLVRASDAVEIDSTGLTIDQVVDQILSHVPRAAGR